MNEKGSRWLFFTEFLYYKPCRPQGNMGNCVLFLQTHSDGLKILLIIKKN